MLVLADQVLGTIGGGQLEWEALAAARLACAASAPIRRQRIVLGADRGQCCGGVVELWMERYTRADLGLLRSASAAARTGPVLLASSMRQAGTLRRLITATGWSDDADQLLRLPRAQAMPRISDAPSGEPTLLERLDDALPPLWLYGAGHVGQALARILVDLPLRLTWIDSRAGQFPAELADRARILSDIDPVDSVAAAPSGTRFLVLTHSHPLDYALCVAILRRGDFSWAGLIGSKSKAARFRSRFARDGIEARAVARLVCPIGIGGIASKWPAAIAVGVAAQVLRDLSAGSTAPAAAATSEPRRDCAATDCAGCGAPAEPVGAAAARTTETV
jgi:xanthine dehydrogenase accessory factor